MKAEVAAFNQEKALVGAFSVIVQPVVEPMEHYTALVETLFRQFSHYNEGHHAEHGFCGCFSSCAWPTSEGCNTSCATHQTHESGELFSEV